MGCCIILCFRLAGWGVTSCIHYFYVLGGPVGVLYPLFLCFSLACWGVVSSISMF